MTITCERIKVETDEISSRSAKDPAERRQEPRYSASETVTFRLVHGERSEQHTAELLNVSRSGMKIRSGGLLLIGSLVIVRLTRFTILGEVRYSKPVDAAMFETGLRIAEANWTDENTPVAVEDLEAWRIVPVEEERLIA